MNSIKVYKYDVPIGSHGHSIDMPSNSMIVHVGTQQNEYVTFWATVSDGYYRFVERVFLVMPTGELAPSNFSYVGTTQAPPYVWHLFEQEQTHDNL